MVILPQFRHYRLAAISCRSAALARLPNVGRVLQALLLAMLLCAPVLGIDRDLRIEQLHHTSWTHKDGAPGEMMALAQTTDGFLWIGARDGLYRFDGIRFELYQPPNGVALPNIEIASLLAVPDGGLWIGFNGWDTAFLKDGRVSTYPEPAGWHFSAHSLARDNQGTIWRAGTSDGLSRFTGSRWEEVGAERGFSGGAYVLYVDRAGTLWVDTFHGLVFLPSGARQFQRQASLLSGWGPFAESRDGTLWILDWTPPNVPKLRSARSGRVLRQFDKQARVYKMFADRQGSLWVGTIGHGINRTQYPERADGKNVQEVSDTADIFRQKDGLSGDAVIDLLEDREGDVWVATNGGLDRFRQSRLISVKFPADTLGFSLSALENGDVWVATMFGKNPLVTIRDGKAAALKPPFAQGIHSSYRGSDGALWLGTETGIMRFFAGKADRIDLPGPPSKSTDVFPYSMTTDGAGRLLALFAGRGFRRLENGQWTDLKALEIPASCNGTTVASDPAGRVWKGCTDNRVILLDGNKMRMFTGNDGLNVGLVETIQSHKDSVWIAGAQGLQQFDGHRFETVAPADGSGFRGVKGIIATSGNGIWIGEARGIIHIEETETRRIEKDPRYRVNYEVLDASDGLSDRLQSPYPAPNMIEGTDGRLWFATAQGVAWLDPKRVPPKPLPPSATVISLSANGDKHLLPVSALINLPAHTTSLQFAYTAGSLAVPERVRFRYKLEGQDKDWQDGGASRQASYTNLGPGSYRFHLMASNTEGVWKEAETTVGFLIQPTFFQTYWFYSLCALAALGVLWQLYRFRMRQVSAQMQGRLEERMAERERIARELHDTLLQGFQGLTLHFQGVMKQIPDELPARETMRKALGYADGVLKEARERVRDLRAEGPTAHDLSLDLTSYGEGLAGDKSVKFKITIVGTPRLLHPVAGDEIRRIAREALANAFQHSQASSIEVEMTYDPAGFSLRVRDDGVGIDQNVLNSGRQGHWGLSGMRERARKVGGDCRIWSSAGKGTEIDLKVAARVAYVCRGKVKRGET
jgi:signal transduction histidine kinase/ligand-binding sensor domain-containing protein